MALSLPRPLAAIVPTRLVYSIPSAMSRFGPPTAASETTIPPPPTAPPSALRPVSVIPCVAPPGTSHQPAFAPPIVRILPLPAAASTRDYASPRISLTLQTQPPHANRLNNRNRDLLDRPRKRESFRRLYRIPAQAEGCRWGVFIDVLEGNCGDVTRMSTWATRKPSSEKQRRGL